LKYKTNIGILTLI